MKASDLIRDSDVAIRQTLAQREGQKTVLDLRTKNDSISPNFIQNGTQMKIQEEIDIQFKTSQLLNDRLALGNLANMRCSVETHELKELDVDQRT